MLEVLSWNLFHGRDHPPDRSLDTWRSRLFRVTEDDGEYLQVNRSLREEFAGLIAERSWSVCLLQEVPPKWAATLAERCGAEAVCCLTSRNQFAFITRRLAEWSPDLIRSWEGGANVTLVRPPWRIAAGTVRSLLLSRFRERGLAERRRMSFVRVSPVGGDAARAVCVANLHADSGPRSEPQIKKAARTALEWAGPAPIVLGGDFNLRPRATQLFGELESEYGLAEPTAPHAIDHVLGRGLQAIEPARFLPPETRELEVPFDGGVRRLRLSDHDPVEATFAMRY